VTKPEGKKPIERSRVGLYGKIILKRILKRYYEVVDWIDLAQNRGKCRAFVSTVMNLQVP
jgi:hypothetical protein